MNQQMNTSFLAILFLIAVLFSQNTFSEETEISLRRLSPFTKINPLTKPENSSATEDSWRNEDIKLSTPKLIKKYGYSVEEHKAVTKDGYILTLFRIPKRKHTRKASKRPSKRVALLVHGFFGSSTDWISNHYDNALAYELADADSDVWLANLRGNVYSREHVFLDTDSSEYWNFSFHEMGKHDVPTMIDYILEKTNQSRLYYIGHSLGSNALLIATSLYPEFSSKVRIMFAMAPGVYFDNMSSPLKYLAPLAYSEQLALQTFGRSELVATSLLNIIRAFGTSSACNLGRVSEDLCFSALYLMANVDNTQLNMTWLPVILANYPSKASSKTLVHLLQVYNSRIFQQYDYGFYGNLEEYEHTYPPEYNLANFKAPVAIFSATDDILVTTEDVARLQQRLSNVIHYESVPARSFGHFGFLFSNKASTLVYSTIIDLMKRY